MMVVGGCQDGTFGFLFEMQKCTQRRITKVAFQDVDQASCSKGVPGCIGLDIGSGLPNL